MQTLSVTYIKCPFCTAKNHCADCSREMTELLRGKRGIRDAQIDLQTKTARIDHSLDEDELEDLLDAMGLLLG